MVPPLVPPWRHKDRAGAKRPEARSGTRGRGFGVVLGRPTPERAAGSLQREMGIWSLGYPGEREVIPGSPTELLNLAKPPWLKIMKQS